MYVCIVYVCVTITLQQSSSIDQPGKVANHVRSWSAEQGKINVISRSPFAPENLVS